MPSLIVTVCLVQLISLGGPHFLKGNREEMDLEKTDVSKGMGGVEEGETVVRMQCMREE